MKASTRDRLLSGGRDVRLFFADFIYLTANSDYSVCCNIAADERVMIYRVPDDMFLWENPDPGYMHINQPDSVFHHYPNLTAVFLDQCKHYKIPCPSGSVTVHG
ncbi:MAG: hypothetical protein WCX22_09550 [Methanoregula sp.]